MLEMRDVHCRFGDIVAVNKASLTIAPGPEPSH